MEIKVDPVAIAVVLALNELAQRLWGQTMSDRAKAVVAIVVGLVWGAGNAYYLGQDPIVGAVNGFFAALAAMGLYSGGASVVKANLK